MGVSPTQISTLYDLIEIECAETFRTPKTPVRRRPSSSTIGENFLAPQTPPTTFQKVIAPRFAPSTAVTATVVNIIPSQSPSGQNCAATTTAIIPLESLTQPQTRVFVRSAQNVVAVEQNLQQPKPLRQPIFHGPFSDISNDDVVMDYQQQNQLPVTSLIMTENGEISIQNNNILLTGEEMARDSFDAQRATPNMHSNVQSGQSIPLDLHDLSLQSNSSIFGFTLNTPLKKALLNQESTQIDDKPCSSKQLTLDFSLDSLKSGNSLMGLSSSADIHLQNDVKRSMQLMNEQDSVEFCRNFAQLADVLVTPKKDGEFETNRNYFN
uniref:Uncharacterized protein n=1 Tax=Romanomermis culicivorax TaxID=13658 RepID=A0A915J2Z2_ROMCU